MCCVDNNADSTLRFDVSDETASPVDNKNPPTGDVYKRQVKNTEYYVLIGSV